jgi:hypothetical protein
MWGLHLYHHVNQPIKSHKFVKKEKKKKKKERFVLYIFIHKTISLKNKEKVECVA